MTSPNPDVVDRVNRFFSLEAFSLREYLADILVPNDSAVSCLVDATVDRLSDTIERLPALVAMIRRFNRRSELLTNCSNDVPSLINFVDGGRERALSHELSTTFKVFGRLHLDLIQMANAYGIGPSSGLPADEAINTRYSKFDDKSRDHVLKQVVSPKEAHLVFWDIPFGLKLTGIEQEVARRFERLVGDFEVRLNSETKEVERTMIQKQLSALNCVLAELPTPSLSPHRFDALQSAVESYFEGRLARLF